MIKLTNIQKEFTDGSNIIVAVNNVSLSFETGEFVAIIGPSGSGKSTLLTIVGALQKPTKGILEIDHQTVYTLKDTAISDIRFNKIGFVLQGSNLVPYLKVKEQFFLKKSLAKNKETYDLDTLLEKLEILKLKNKYPDELSGGERQRVAIALSLYLKPSILLADEPTASLDTKKAYDVVEILETISKELNTTVIMVTHDTRLLSKCDKIYEMNDGILSQSHKY